MGCFAHFRGPPPTRFGLPQVGCPVHLAGNDRLRAIRDRDVLMNDTHRLLPTGAHRL